MIAHRDTAIARRHGTHERVDFDARHHRILCSCGEWVNTERWEDHGGCPNRPSERGRESSHLRHGWG